MIVMKRVLVATDFSETSDAALAYGRSLARQFGAALHVLHIMDNAFLRPTAVDPAVIKATAWRALRERVTDSDRNELKAHPVIETSDTPAEAIADYATAAHIDLVVVGTHGRSGLSRFLMGSVAERVVRIAPCPVLSVHHPEQAVSVTP